ncbi:MAG: biopolymer transporter ExbD [Candidatus Rokuibacteriota bacterium]
MAIRVDAGAEGAARVRSSLAEINVIPLVDVVLVLLLIFMLTAPMMYRGIDVSLPKSGGRPTAIEERLVLTVTKDRLLYLNERALPLQTLEPRLRELLRDRTDKTIFIKADKDLQYGYVVETMDRLRRAGVDRVGMVTEPLAKRE